MTEVKEKSKAGRKCVICTHADTERINLAITDGVSFRTIAHQNGGFDKNCVSRHAQNCLGIDVRVIAEKQRAAQAINVYEEFAEQLAFAKTLRDTAQMYLSDPDDPFGLFLGPQAHEIDITYYDHNDLEEVGSGENITLRPKKKKAKLNDLLAEMAGKGFESSRVEIKTLDIRKYALDAISTADVCIDKFARMGGAYQKDKNNQADVGELIDGLVERLIAKGWERQAAREFAQTKYNTGGPLLLGNGG